MKIKLLSVLTVFFVFSSTALSAGFSDVPGDHWASQEISELSEAGIIGGFQDGTFKPERTVSRAQAAALIGRTLELDVTSIQNPGFTDITENTTGYRYIAKLTELGIFNQAAQFNPNQSLTRSQMAKILTESFSLTGSSMKRFSDLTPGGEAATYAGTLYKAGITTGTSSSTFSPNAPVLRANMAVFLSRTLEFLSDNPDGNAGTDYTEPSAIEKEILRLVNIERQNEGLQPLTFKAEMQFLADLKSKDMADNNYFDHTSPTYGSPQEMVAYFGYPWSYVGENIAAGYPTAQAVVKGWMESPGHRANILNENYTHIGIGHYEGGYYGDYYTQMFLRE
ncbi:hypothetical protein KP77_27660 [Jeotgalibacillus alimentarius]|uniref:SLH domain-containing protein n=1 Tax=Jeotgalibacillus alimentarius TaxID=135826 RepID=A0A0C2RXY4_9BACL|nr:S-layer homology domain-containing protein [Jeotgalibacillus alimentarius]KIL46639.1 hypothetical protein KP77_27660 [Jeotgalibacillus alimentarius]